METGNLASILINHIQHGELFQIKRLCETSPKALSILKNHKDLGGNSCLLIATASGHLEIVQFLLGLKMDVNASNEYGWNPLLLSAYHYYPSVFRHLVSLPGINIDSCNAFGHNALMICIYRGHLDLLYVILDHGSDPNFRDSLVSSAGMSPLMMACFKGNKFATSSLLSRGAEANAQNKLNMWTPLMYAVRVDDKECSVELAKMLVEYGADFSTRDCVGNTCTDVAVMVDNQLFLDTMHIGSDTSSFYSSTKGENHIKRSTTIIKDEALTLENKRPAIIEAIFSKNRPLLISLLASKEPMLNEVDKATGMTPLMCAVVISDRVAVRYLVENGADVNEKHTFSGWTSLMFAVYHRNHEIMEILLEHGAETKHRGIISEYGPMLNPSVRHSMQEEALFSAKDIAISNGFEEGIQLIEKYESKRLESLTTKLVDNAKVFDKVGNAIDFIKKKLKSKQKSPSRLSLTSLRRKSMNHESLNAPDRTSAFNQTFFDDDTSGSNQTTQSFKKSSQYFSIITNEAQYQEDLTKKLESKEIQASLNGLKEKWKAYSNIDEMIGVKEAEELAIFGIKDINERYELFLDILKYRQHITMQSVNRIRDSL